MLLHSLGQPNKQIKYVRKKSAPDAALRRRLFERYESNQGQLNAKKSFGLE